MKQCYYTFYNIFEKERKSAKPEHFESSVEMTHKLTRVILYIDISILPQILK